MRKKAGCIATVIGVMFVMMGAWAETYSIPADKIDDQKIFWGTAASFEKPAQVDYRKIIRATEEYASIKKNKIEAGSAKYWILISKASEQAIRAIAEVGEETDYDLIAEKDYLGALEPSIPADDITSLVLKKFK